MNYTLTEIARMYRDAHEKRIGLPVVPNPDEEPVDSLKRISIGGEVFKISGGGGGEGGTSDYEDLDNLPKINGVTLFGNKTSQDLKISDGTKVEANPSSEPTKHLNTIKIDTTTYDIPADEIETITQEEYNKRWEEGTLDPDKYYFVANTMPSPQQGGDMDVMTQEEYDKMIAEGTYDPDKFYFVTESFAN